MKKINTAIILSEFNIDIVENLYLGVRKCFDENNQINVNEKKIYVPGAFELPYMAKEIQINDLKNKQYELDFIITLGCVIKGETAHFEYISGACANSLSILNLQSHIPIMFGVITAYNKSQAIERSQINFDKKDNYNIGYNVAKAAISMIDSVNKK